MSLLSGAGDGHVRGIGSAVLGALVISIVTTLLELVLRPLERQPESIIRRG